MNRRLFLAGVIAASVSARLHAASRVQRSGSRLVLLGTGGGPRPHVGRSAPAQAIIVNGTVYVVDCGDGVARQLVRAGVPLPKLRHVFITHQHSDHTADFGNLLLLAWATGLRSRVDAWGPPPLERMTRLFFEMNAADIDTRIADEGRPPIEPFVHVRELRRPGFVMRDEYVTVTAALVNHPPVRPSFAYRFDCRDRSIVISGDTTPSESLVELAKGADVLVHEAMLVEAVDRIVADAPNAATLKQHLLASHTTAEDCGRIAAAAGVGMLVLSHLVPAEDARVTDETWLAAVRAHFKGPVIVGNDLMEL